MVGFVGATGGNPSENMARMFAQLKPLKERGGVSSDQVIQRLRQKTTGVVGVQFFMQVAQDINVGGRLTATQYQYTLSDTNSEELNTWAPKIQAGMEKLHELQDVTTDQQIASPHIMVSVDRDAAYRLGLSLAAIDNTLYDAFGQRQIGYIYTSTNQYWVIMEVQPQFQTDPSALEHIYVPGNNGSQVPISTVARFTTKVEPLTVNHQGQFPAVTLSFNLPPGVSLGPAVEKINAMQAQMNVPPTLQGSFQGDRAGVPAVAVLDAALGRGRHPGRLHRAGHALRELHPPDHHPLGAALGRRRRADHADGVPLRPQH